MATKVELAYRALQSVLQAAASASDDCPDTVHRNRVTATLLDTSRNGAVAVMNLVDEKGRYLSEEVNDPGEDGLYEIVQRATLEVVVYHPDPEETDRRFDAIMEMLADVFTTIDLTLGGRVDDVAVTDPPDRMLLAAYPGAKAARVSIDMLMSLPTVFG